MDRIQESMDLEGGKSIPLFSDMLEFKAEGSGNLWPLQLCILSLTLFKISGAW